MTTMLTSGRTRLRRSTAALGIAGLVLAGLAGPALADGNDPVEEETTTGSDDPSGEGDEEQSSDNSEQTDPEGDDAEDGSDQPEEADEDGEDLGEEPDPELAITAASVDTVTVDLVGVNDFHGRIDANLQKPDRSYTTEGAAVLLATAVEEARAKNPDTFFVGAGDLYSASTFTSMAGNDIPTTDVFNAMGMDTSAVGNHEFDRGFADLVDRIEGNDEYDGHAIAWKYLGANVYEAGTTNAVLPEYLVLSTDDIDIAFIGLVTQETPSLVTPKGIEGLDFGDPAEAVARVAQYQEVQDADTIVILTHDGGVNADAVTDTSTHFGAFVAAMAERGDVAGIFSGHTHTDYEVQVDLPTTATSVEGMPVIQTGSFGENLGLISLDFEVDEAGNATLISADSELRAMWKIEPPSVGVNNVVDDVRGIVEAAVNAAEGIGKEIIGAAGADLMRARHIDPQSGNLGENRGGESTISNLIADAQLWAVHELGATDDPPVIAFMNPGGVRTDITAGEVTYKEAADVQPFANTLETLDLTGAQIKDVLEEQWQPDGASRPFLKLGLNAEFFYTYDPEADRGERITAMYLEGQEIDPAATYRVVTNNFLASGGDNFFTLGQGANYADTGLVDLAAFVDYFKAHDVVNPDYAQRAVGVHWVTGADTEYAPGDDVELHLSSLVFSNDEPKSTELRAALRGGPPSFPLIPLGSFDIDPEIVNTNDESGRAIVKLTIPSADVLGDVAGAWMLTLNDDLEQVDIAVSILLGEPADNGEGDDEKDKDADEDGAGTKPDTGESLPDTGVDIAGLAVVSALLLAIGGAAVAVRRRQMS